MPHYSFRPPERARAIAAGWGLLGGLVPAGLALWQGAVWAGLVLAAGGAGAAAGLWLWCGQRLVLYPAALERRGGPLLAVRRVVRRRAVVSGLCFATPLLRLARCRVVVLFTLRRSLWLPPLARADAQALLFWLKQDSDTLPFV